jgi:xanthine dehydrogenase YagR molybdenum-binding subunit
MAKLTQGIASVGLGEVERSVPADEAPPLAPNAALSVIGKSVPRWNGRQKVTGAVRFTADVNLPGMLHGRFLRSPHAHARIRAIDTSAAERHPGVRAVLVILGPNGGGTTSATAEEGVEATRRNVQPIALYAGQAIAAVAARSVQAAEAAVRLIKVDYEPLPFVIDMDAALAPRAPVVFEKLEIQPRSGGGMAVINLPLVGNLRGPARTSRGDAAAGMAAAEVVVEAEYRTQVQMHCCLEPHGLVADWRRDGLTVYASTQFTAGVRDELARGFGLPMSRVRVITDAMGGGFGSKSTLGTYGRVAVELSRKAGAPVRLVLDRAEEQVDSGNRPATWQHLRIGARRDGTLAAISLESRGTAGTAIGAGVGNVAERMYTCPNFEQAQSDVFINAGPGCAMRAPGAVPGAFALEQSVDELADKLGLDPLALRDRIDPSPARREERRIGADLIGWDRRHPAGSETGPVRTGLGVAQSLWGSNVHVTASCEVRILRDGSVEVLSSVQDIGTGSGTVLAQVIAEELGLRPEDITVRIGDTDFPAGPPSHGSRTTASITPPARNAAHQVCLQLLALAAPLLGVPPDDLRVGGGRIASVSNPARSMSFREAAAHMRTEQLIAYASRSDDYAGFRARMGDAALALNDIGGVQFAAVTVDTETGLVRVERMVAVHDCGRPINPRQIESQIHGGILQGLGYALLEERILDAATGHMMNADLEAYKLPGAFEVPAIEVRLLENYQGFSSTDAYGIAEPALVATAPAIANAIANALGVRLRALPMNRAAILAAIGAGKDAGR